MSMETDPQAEYWATYDRKWAVVYETVAKMDAEKAMKSEPPTIGLYLRTILLGVRDTNPWTDGSYALSAIVWGLILMLVWSLSI